MKTLQFFCIAALAPACTAQAQPKTPSAAPAAGCRIEIDLRQVVNDRLTVLYHPAPLRTDTAVYNLPKIVPGTYSISDFGRFVDDFEAIDRNGAPMQVLRLDTNRWAIPRATQLASIRYKVNDTFDAPRSGIFEPGGTTIEEDKVFLLNMFGFAGYFDGQRDLPYTLTVHKPNGFYGATSLTSHRVADETDQFTAKNYFELHDCPILYARPDTAGMKLANARVLVANYSPAGKVRATEILEAIAPVFTASAEYLGGELPVNRYTVLVYLMGGNNFAAGFGALEHHTSTVFVMPEMGMKALGQTFRDVTAHEFFHIVTPLSIHSEHIHDYDFVNPTMSRHLWLYEGCTEYAAQHVQVKHGLITHEDFYQNMRSKMLAAAKHDASIPFTEMSTHVLTKYKKEYPNVYQQGALIGMALDLKLLHLSNGSMDLQKLLRLMASEYGPDRPFEDARLFEELGRISGHPEVVSFLYRHVAGTTPLPFDTLLAYAGVYYQPEVTETTVSGGNVGVGYNPRRDAMVVSGSSRMDEFGKALGLMDGDELVSWAGEAITKENVREVIEQFKQRTTPGQEVVVVVNRKNAKDRYKTITLRAKAIATTRTRRHAIEPMTHLTDAQRNLRLLWIGS